MTIVTHAYKCASAVVWREQELEMSSELLATYAGLGTHDGERYYKGEECLGMSVQQRFPTNSMCPLYVCVCVCVLSAPACVKDLIRALRADDSRCEIRRELGRARVLQKVNNIIQAGLHTIYTHIYIHIHSYLGSTVFTVEYI